MEAARNLAYRRAAYQSSSYSVNETAQLVTVGLEETDEARMGYEYLHRDGNRSRYGNVKYLFEEGTDRQFETYTTDTWVQVRLPAKKLVSEYEITAGTAQGDTSPFPSDFILLGSLDGVQFEELDHRTGEVLGEHETRRYTVKAPSERYTHFRLLIQDVCSGDRIHLAGWQLFDEEGKKLLCTYQENKDSYVSAWMSAGAEKEWISVDLGAASTIDRVRIYWGSMYALEYAVQISPDGMHWTQAAENRCGQGGMEELCFPACKARHVRLFCKKAPEGQLAYIVREFEVYGTNDFVYVPEKKGKTEPGRQFLNDCDWYLERVGTALYRKHRISDALGKEEQRECFGIRSSQPEFPVSEWLRAVVPGTVFGSYLKAGAVADPIYADWQSCASDSYFKSDFWYRTSFRLEADKQGSRVSLHFDAINWKAEVFLNGVPLGRILGGFIRAEFDITGQVFWDRENTLSVLIIQNTDAGIARASGDDGPGNMGGIFGNDGSLGDDAPTISAAGGWDWVPSVRGRALGIYNDVYLTYGQEVKLSDPWAVTEFSRHADGSPDLSEAAVTIRTDVENTGDTAVELTVEALIQGVEGAHIEKRVTLAALEKKEVEIGQIKLSNPSVWWPNGYGEQPLYPVLVTAKTTQGSADTKEFLLGVREFGYQVRETGDADPNGYRNGTHLTMFCNGVRIIIRGGNWGLEDIHLDVDAKKYDDKIRLHRYENFNIIRNWGGQINDVELYRACDKYGILIWDDFFLPGCWLNVPKDKEMFLASVQDKIRHYRSHACLALYCGANEMFVEDAELEAGMRRYVKELDGTRYYFPNSGKAPVAEDGPHSAQFPEFYFRNTLPDMMNSERGMPNFPSAESMRKIFPPDKLWPPNSLWALHDFALRWNLDGAGYLKKIEAYGTFDTFEEMIRRAQLLAYELHKAMFEGSICGRSNGLMMWMSNPAWTSLVWQSYDYFHDINGGYSGIRTACQQENLIWNRSNDCMELFYGKTGKAKRTAVMEVFDADGSRIDVQQAELVMESGTVKTAFAIPFHSYAPDFVFLRTRVLDEAGNVTGENFYWNNRRDYRDFRVLGDMPEAMAEVCILSGQEQDAALRYQLRVVNKGTVPALLLRLRVVSRQSKRRILPVFYEDNHFFLMPGEEKTLCLEFGRESIGKDTPEILLDGFNLTERPTEKGF